MNGTAAATMFRPFALMLGQWRVTDAIRGAVFVTVVLLAWITMRPFEDLGTRPLNGTDGNDTMTYVAFGGLAVIAVLLVIKENLRAFATVLTPGFMMFGAWLVASVVFSMEPATSSRRLALTLCVISLTAAMMLLPRSRDQLTRWLLIAAAILLAVCYLGVTLAPQFSTHHITDTNEAHLAGSWRGSFGHKNIAAGVMVMLIFIGIYAMRSGAMLSGAAVIGAAFIFLLNTGGKTSLALTFLVLLVTSLTSLVRSFSLRVIMLLSPLITLNMLSIGAVMSDGLAELAKNLPLDASFTGRTDIWNFALEHLRERLLTGYGFATFWQTELIRNLPEGKEWAETASHSHNGYLDTALWIGLPGLALMIVVIVIAPLRNFQRADELGNAGPLLMLFLRLWTFGIYLSALETFLLDRADPMWVTFLLAVFGLHYLARFRLQT